MKERIGGIVDIRHAEIFVIVLMLLPLYIVAVTPSVTFEGHMETEVVGNLRQRPTAPLIF